MKEPSDLSMDARVLISAWFSFGERTSVKIGGTGAESILSDRAEVAMQELVDKGYVEAFQFNSHGRMEYVGTAKCVGQRLSRSAMEAHGNWSPTKPNPARQEAR